MFDCLSDLTAPAIHKVEGCEGVDGGGLGAQAVVAQGDGLEAEGEAAAQLVGTEVAFGADEHEGVGAGGVELVEGAAVVADAVADVFLNV